MPFATLALSLDGGPMVADQGFGALRTLVEEHEFHVALVAALIGAAVAALAAFVRRGPVPVGGLLATGAALIALQGTRFTELPDELLIGLGLLVIGSLVTFSNRALPLHAVAAIPGALLVASALPGVDLDWAPLFVIGSIVIAAPLVCDFDRAFARTAWAGPLVAVSAFGVWSTVPDAERSIPLVAATLPLILLALPRPLATLGAPGSFALVGLFVWIATVEGRGRAGSIVGAVACLGVLLVDPIARRIVPIDARSQSADGPSLATHLVTGALHVVTVYVCARVAGFRTSPAAAAAIAGVTLAGACMVLCAWRFHLWRETSD